MPKHKNIRRKKPPKTVQQKFDTKMVNALTWLGKQNISQRQKANVLFRGYGCVLHMLKLAYDEEGTPEKIEWLFNYARNLDKISDAQKKKIPFEEISDRFICKEKSKNANNILEHDPMFR